MVPQLCALGSPSPTNCRPAAVSTANTAEPRKVATISEVSVGRISAEMM